MKISLNNFTINKIPVIGDIEFIPGRITLIEGENGVGKSSILHELNLNHVEYFRELKARFIEQQRFTTLNEVSISELFKQLELNRIEQIDIFDEIKFKIESFKGTPINNLSGGQNQLAKIALSLFLSGDIFFFDEPLQFLDKENIDFFHHVLAKLIEMNKMICIIEHADCEFKKWQTISHSAFREDCIYLRRSNGAY